jgi:FliA/WhiG family RNA polymerase sigma factor
VAEQAGTVKTLQGKPGAVPTVASVPPVSAQEMLKNLRDRMVAMPAGKRTWLLASVIFLAAATAALVWYAQRPDWKVLFSGLEARDAAQVTQELAAAGVAYRMSADGESVEVPSDAIDKARIEVAAKGMPQFRIRGAILDSLRTLDWSPRELRRKGRAVEEAIRAATHRLGRAPAEQEIAAEMELSLNEFQQLLGDLKGLEIGSLHMERTEDSGDQELAYIPGSPDEDPLFRCLKGELKQRLTDAIDELPERERLVLTLYYYEELTMKEIGLTLGVVESRVSQIHSAAVLRLRVALAALRSAGEVRKGPGRVREEMVKRRGAA